MSIIVFMDCGAPSLYNKVSRKNKGSNVMGAGIRNRRMDSFEYVKTKEYLDYRDRYVAFIKDNPHIDTYPNLDVINNAELTYANQKWMEKKGVRPCPVWHLGSDRKWLRRYLDEGYDYICMGGMVPNSKAMLFEALDSLWAEELTDAAGMPRVKVHGFALTSFDLMVRYPWYSVDSKSWIDHAQFGGILVPAFLPDGRRNYLRPSKIWLTPRSVGTHSDVHHFLTTSQGVRNGVLRYLEEELHLPLGVTEFRPVKRSYKPKLKLGNEAWIVDPADGLSSSQIHRYWRKLISPEKPGLVEWTVERGVTNTYTLRLDANLQLYTKIEEHMPKWPWPLSKRRKKSQGLFGGMSRKALD